MRSFVIQPWISYRGAETVSVLQTYYQVKAGIETKIICLFTDKDRMPPLGNKVEYVLPAVWLQKLFSRSKIFFLLFCVPVLFWLVLRNVEDGDTLYPHNLPSPWIAALIKKFKNVKVYWICHGVPPQAGFENSAFNNFAWNFGVSFIDRKLIRSFNGIIAVSKKVAKDVQVAYKKEAKVVYPPVEWKLYVGGKKDDIRKHHSISKDDFLILHVSNLHKAKEPEFSLKVLKAFLKSVKNAKLMFVGVGDDTHSFLEKVRRMNLTDKVIFEKFVHPEKLKDYYAASDCVIVPYWKSEGCPIPPMQALCSDKMSIVAEGSGIDEIIKDQNIGFVAKRNVGDFTKKLIYLYKNAGNFKSMSKKGLTFIKKDLSGEKFVININN